MDEELLPQWQIDGWLHLRAFVPPAVVLGLNDIVEETWSVKPRDVTVDDLDLLERTTMARLTNEQRSHRIKINDLYLASPELRRVLLDRRLIELAASFIGDIPVLCNSLNLERSSAQEYHADSLYMTPPTPGGLVAAWIALEDVKIGSGPLRLYPGSHRLPPYAFRRGNRPSNQEEIAAWGKYMQRELDARGMKPHVVYASAGDLVLWHADLLHGAEQIDNPNLTRRSVAAHYLRDRDCHALGYVLRGNRYERWVKRLPQPTGVLSKALVGLQRQYHRLRSLPYRLKDRHISQPPAS